MASRLTQVAINTRKAVRFGLYFVIFFFIARFTLNIAGTLYRTIFPPPPPPPTVAFDRLPALPFPEKKDLPTFDYRVETPSGSLPTFDTQANVYFMPKAGITLTSLEDARRKASGMGFRGEATEITPTIYRFAHESTSATLEMNIVNGTFSVSYNLANDPQPLDSQPPTAEIAVNLARAFLSTGGSAHPQLDGPTSHEYLRVTSAGLSSVLALSEANLVKINLFRKAYDELPAKHQIQKQQMYGSSLVVTPEVHGKSLQQRTIFSL